MKNDAKGAYLTFGVTMPFFRERKLLGIRLANPQIKPGVRALRRRDTPFGVQTPAIFSRRCGERFTAAAVVAPQQPCFLFGSILTSICCCV